MEKKISILKERLAAARASTKKNYPRELRAEVVKVASAWRQTGRTRGELIRKLEMSAATLDSWVKSAGVSPRPAVRPVDVVVDAETRLVAKLGAGVRIEGLSIEDVIELARGLA